MDWQPGEKTVISSTGRGNLNNENEQHEIAGNRDFFNEISVLPFDHLIAQRTDYSRKREGIVGGSIKIDGEIYNIIY